MKTVKMDSVFELSVLKMKTLPKVETFKKRYNRNDNLSRVNSKNVNARAYRKKRGLPSRW